MLPTQAPQRIGLQGLGIEWCKAPDVGLLAPDLTLFLDIPIADAAARGNFGEVCGQTLRTEPHITIVHSAHHRSVDLQERYETTSFQGRVYDKFKELQTPDWKVRLCLVAAMPRGYRLTRPLFCARAGNRCATEHGCGCRPDLHIRTRGSSGSRHNPASNPLVAINGCKKRSI